MAKAISKPLSPPASNQLIDAFCTTCSRTTYVRGGADLTCPVCSMPLVEIDPAGESEAR